MKEKEAGLVFQALGSADRRVILDLLRKNPGMQVGELSECFETSRFAVMKHLKILQEANLVSSVKRGRASHLYLNAIPLRTIYERWISKQTSNLAGSITSLKIALERDMSDTKNDKSTEPLPEEVFVIYIKSTPQAVWQALTDPAWTRQFYLGADVQSSFKKGAAIQYLFPDEKGQLEIGVEGKIIEVDPPWRLVHSFYPVKIDPERKEDDTIVTYDIEQEGDQVCLRITHSGFFTGSSIVSHAREGWYRIISSLKTLLESGQPL